MKYEYYKNGIDKELEKSRKLIEKWESIEHKARMKELKKNLKKGEINEKEKR